MLLWDTTGAEKVRFSYVPDRVIPAEKRKKKIEAPAEDFFVEEMLDIPMAALSKGTLQKIFVIQALLGEPDVLFPDEPLSGQDRESAQVFISKMKGLRAAGTTIFLACHESWIYEAVADEIFTFQGKRLIPYQPVENWKTEGEA